MQQSVRHFFRHSVVRIIAVLLMMSIPAVQAGAQVGSANVLGTVTDESGAAVPNANVELHNVATGATFTTTTDGHGEYTFQSVSNGNYDVKITSTGFQSFASTNLTLSVGDRARLDAHLKIGAATETVTVSASTVALLQADTSSVSTTVAKQAVEDLPLNGRNLTSLLQLQPGVTPGFSGSPNLGTTAAGGSSFQDLRPSTIVVANGQSEALNNNLIDGFDNNERTLGLVGLRPSLDAIEEVRLDTSNYAAEFGRTAGAVINIITKQGTNGFHGSAFEFFRNDIFNTRDYFSTTGRRPAFKLNEFGGSIGGPIIKDKTFFFADVEEDRLVRGTTFLTTVPTAYEQAHPGDFSDTGGPNLIAAGATLSPVTLKYLKLIPLPNLPGAVNNYNSSPSFLQNALNVDVRVDHKFTSSDTLFARYGYNPVTTTAPEPWPVDPTTNLYPGGANGAGGLSTTKAQNLQIDYVHVFSSRLLLDLKAGYTRIKVNSLPFDYGVGADKVVGIPNGAIPGLPATDQLTPIAGSIFNYHYVGSTNGLPILNTNNTFEYSGSLTYSRGAHNIKVGAGVIRRQVNLLQDATPAGYYLVNARGVYADARANFLLGNAAALFRQLQFNEGGYRSWEPHAFIQDDWRVTPALTLNFGVRYDIFTPFTEVNGRYANFEPSTIASGIGPQNFILGSQNASIGVSTDHTNVAPRFGFAYSVNSKTIVRGGFGLSFFPADIGVSRGGGTSMPASVLQNQNPPFFFNYFSVAAPSITAGPPVPTPVDLTAYSTNSNVTSLAYKPANLRSSYVEQFNIAVQRQFGANAFTIAYVGILGQRLLRAVNMDQPGPPGAGQATPKYIYQTQLPFVTTITANGNGSYSNYNALQLVYGRTFTKGVTIQANYTLAHNLANTTATGSLGYSLIPSNAAYDYGNSASMSETGSRLPSPTNFLGQQDPTASGNTSCLDGRQTRSLSFKPDKHSL